MMIQPRKVRVYASVFLLCAGTTAAWASTYARKNYFADVRERAPAEIDLDLDALVADVKSEFPAAAVGVRAEWGARTGVGRKEATDRVASPYTRKLHSNAMFCSNSMSR